MARLTLLTILELACTSVEPTWASSNQVYGIDVEPLERALMTPLLDVDIVTESFAIRPTSHELAGESWERCQAGVVLVDYHKTGHDFANEAISILAELTEFTGVHKLPESDTFVVLGEVNYTFGKSFSSMFSDEIALPSGKLAHVHGPSIEWPAPAGACVVHFVRDPVDLIVSGYRYHAQQPEAPEDWQSETSTCHQCDQTAHAELFKACGYVCNYSELLAGIGPELGVVAEALLERQSIRNMLGNILRWTNSSRALHLSVEHLRKNFNGTIRCLLRFLGVDDVDGLLLARFGSLNSAERGQGDKHVTWWRHDNVDLKTFLERQPIWGLEFASARALISAIFDRQSGSYGCSPPQFLRGTEPAEL